MDTGSGSEVLWLRTRTAREPRRAEPLTVARIVAAAVDELDTHGAEQLTMRRLARRLGVSSTALYWHVATKEDLLDLVLDHVMGEIPLPADDADPRTALHELLTGWRSAMLAHPWSPGLIGRPLLGPNVLARVEYMQAALVRAGLDERGLAVATALLADLVIGAATSGATWAPHDDPAVVDRARAHITGSADRYPTLATSGFLDRARWSEDELFGAGLDRVLDSLAVHARTRP